MYAWIRTERIQSGALVLFGFGDFQAGNGRYVGLRDGKPRMVLEAHDPIEMTEVVRPARWEFVAATFDGTRARIYLGEQQLGAPTSAERVAQPLVNIAPPGSRMSDAHFGGRMANFTVLARALDARELRTLATTPPEFALLNFASVSVGWPWQSRQLAGLSQPQAPATLPHSAAPIVKPVLRKNTAVVEPVQKLSDQEWELSAWKLAQADEVGAAANTLSRVGFADDKWYRATVPGTVLTSLIDAGVYPDPDFGLNNLQIPESLNKHDYWYRTEFVAPSALNSRKATLTFNGINYAAEVWLNGERLGNIRGAFIRGMFDVSGKVLPGQNNAIAVRISPPPHPGIPHEQSIAAGPGENGGALALDGPTFIATEGWDWIPGIRDRNSGLWRNVTLKGSGAVRMLDPQIVTRLALPATDRADIQISVPLENSSNAAVDGVLTAAFEGVTVRKTVSLAPGATTIELKPAEFEQLAVKNPRLWWPNGYGGQDLYHLDLTFTIGSDISDRQALRFGMRHITYELSLFDPEGKLRRVEVDPTLARGTGQRIVDVRHEALKKSPYGWAASLYPGALESPAVRPLPDDTLTPHLVIRVNGVRIAARGGNWGMDDSRKRVSRQRLEPYFRLHRDAHLNIIRNWVGQNTEQEFYDLADEYGMLVLNDFWASTQDFQVEPGDPALFLTNARDTVSRFRNHPSIALWFGRNEGVPQPILNEGLADLIDELDGSRYFTGSSNQVNLAGSGPYNYRAPVEYFNRVAQGFSVEVGTPSLSTLESIRAWTPAEDRWPVSDTLAYHDWHQGGNGDTATFMKTLAAQFGAPADLEDFERKAQMMNYVSHRALFEGFAEHLWTRNSGRLLWMTHPSWPSHSWQIYSSDYDTHAAFYGVKKACEPIHVQLGLPDFTVSVVNTGVRQLDGLVVRARVFGLDNKVLFEQRWPLNAPANATARAAILDLSPHLATQKLVFVKLELTSADNRLLAENFYWQAQDDAGQLRLNELSKVAVRATTTRTVRVGDEMRVTATLHNAGAVAALATKLTLLRANGERVLPAYYSDNYVSLLPGEKREIEIAYPVTVPAKADAKKLALRGWNVIASTVGVDK